jgi:dsDNA-specific endonuclease/ATPase MutS2
MDLKSLKDLWIGDLVRVVPTGMIGKFEGSSGDKARILIEGRHHWIEVKDIEVYDEPEPEASLIELLGLEEEKPKKEKSPSFSNELDLHLDKLPPYSSDSGLSILDYQLNHCRQFLEEVIKRRYTSATIIHGKGEGILRDQVIHLLKDFHQIRQHLPKYNGGALEVLIFY